MVDRAPASRVEAPRAQLCNNLAGNSSGSHAASAATHLDVVVQRRAALLAHEVPQQQPRRVDEAAAPGEDEVEVRVRWVRELGLCDSRMGGEVV
jgi:hypothetical protein